MNPAEIAQLLRSEPVRAVSFSVGGRRYGPVQYGRVADAMGDTILVETVDGGGPKSPSAYYSFTDPNRVTHDTLYVRRGASLNRLIIQALIVHESTHVIQDMWGRSMNVIDTEVAAYTAQALYLARRGTTWAEVSVRARIEDEEVHRSPRNPRVDAIIEAADRAAQRLTAGPPLLRPTEEQALRAAIIAHPYYAQRTAHVADMDGVG
ncbi:MAG: hypothetical protein VYE22_27415 [Myxococcota bacterium]|nr:hypothetical protein [Myxococcota bacterium]